MQQVRLGAYFLRCLLRQPKALTQRLARSGAEPRGRLPDHIQIHHEGDDALRSRIMQLSRDRAYPRLLQEWGVEASRILSQACPGLADTISEDREGARTKSEIVRWVGTAIDKMHHNDRPVVACLACTHYGYRKDLFAEALADAGIRAKVVNPNERAVDDLFGQRLDHRGEWRNCEVEVEFVTRYAIPEATVEALTWFLGDISPRTVAAMKNFVHLPDLF